MSGTLRMSRDLVAWSEFGLRLARVPELPDARHARSRSADRLCPGDRFVLPIQGVLDPASRQVVLLHHDDERGWTVVVPTAADEVVPLDELRRDEDGAWLVEVSTAARPGLQRWAAALPGRDYKVRWELPEVMRWKPLLEDVARGEVPVVSGEVLVEVER